DYHIDSPYVLIILSYQIPPEDTVSVIFAKMKPIEVNTLKHAKIVFTIIFLLILGSILFIWIQREIEFQEELAARPLPDSLHPIVEEKSRELVAAAEEIGIN